MGLKTTRSFRVVGGATLHCSGCEGSVHLALARLPGVEYVKADHRTQRIEVTWTSDDPDINSLRAELDWMGYTVEEA